MFKGQHHESRKSLSLLLTLEHAYCKKSQLLRGTFCFTQVQGPNALTTLLHLADDVTSCLAVWSAVISAQCSSMRTHHVLSRTCDFKICTHHIKPIEKYNGYVLVPQACWWTTPSGFIIHQYITKNCKIMGIGMGGSDADTTFEINQQ